MKYKIRQLKISDEIKIYDKLFFAVVFALAFLFMSHPDVWETANHSYMFLESLFSGNFFNFYDYVAQHNNSYYYLNNAHYNVLIYIIFGIWQLPVFIFNNIFNLALNENFIIYWSKFVSVGFYVASGYMMYNIAQKLGLEKTLSKLVALFFVFNPIAFYSPVAMGQYDSLCVFFMLWAINAYLSKKYYKFTFIMGIGLVCKFFPLLVFVPLILLAEKKFIPLLKHFALVFWLYVPTTLLFLGRTGNASLFTKLMIDRLFDLTVDIGMGSVSVFLIAYAFIIFFAFLYKPENEKKYNYMAVYISMVVFGLLFLTILWHPQWLILLIPFVVLTTFMQKNKLVWFLVDIIMVIGFFLFCFFKFPHQSGAALFTGGLLGHTQGVSMGFAPHWQPISKFLTLIPYSEVITSAMFTGAIGVNMVFKLPFKNMSLADEISKNSDYDKVPLKVMLYAVFIIGFIGVWLMPSLLELINAYGLI